MSDPIYHLAVQSEWQEALSGGEPYRRSTVGRSLEDVGFIHCSYASQVAMTADLFYRGRSDVVLLRIDPSRVQAEIRAEDLHGGGSPFPHIYGPLPLDAVTRVDQVPASADGRLDVASLLGSA